MRPLTEGGGYLKIALRESRAPLKRRKDRVKVAWKSCVPMRGKLLRKQSEGCKVVVSVVAYSRNELFKKFILLVIFKRRTITNLSEITYSNDLDNIKIKITPFLSIFT